MVINVACQGWPAFDPRSCLLQLSGKTKERCFVTMLPDALDTNRQTISVSA